MDREAPLTDRELKILRGMLEEYSYRLRRRKALGDVFSDVRIGVGVTAALMVVAMQAAELFLILTGHR
jgi:hypothetical protein